jgi:hypothetical protein
MPYQSGRSRMWIKVVNPESAKLCELTLASLTEPPPRV